jgi:hypothetical protein
MALLKIGIPERQFGVWQPAVAFGFQRSFVSREHPIDGVNAASDVAQGYLSTSYSLAWLSLHAGASVWDARAQNATMQLPRGLFAKLRPFGGATFTPPWYPRTTLIGEISWVPSFDPGAIELRFIASWAVRYRVTRFADVELGMRFRETAGLHETQVLMRANFAGKIW